MRIRTGARRAALWHAGTHKFINLNPDGFKESGANAISGQYQVGYASKLGTKSAALWTGSSSSFVDLGLKLPAEYYDSQALNLYVEGDTIKVVGFAFKDRQERAVMWTITSG